MAVPAAPAAGRSPPSTVRPHGRRHRRRRRRAAAPAPGRPARLPRRPGRRGARPVGPPPRWPDVFGAAAPARCAAFAPARAAAGRPARCLRAGRRARRATAAAMPTAPSCSTTAAARPTRSAGCCCTCYGVDDAPSLRAQRRHLQRAAADQLLAGPRASTCRAAAATCRRRTARACGIGARRLRALPAAGSDAPPAAALALVARSGLGARADARGRAAGAPRCPAAPAGSCALVVQGGLRILDKIEARASTAARAAPRSAGATRRAWPGAPCGCGAIARMTTIPRR